MTVSPPPDTSIHGPQQTSRYWYWKAETGSIQIRFVGRGPDFHCQKVLRAVSSSPTQIAWLEQTHSRRVVAARPGANGQGDALLTDRENLALSVATADCVPILLAVSRSIAAVHAGWRGIVAGIVETTLGKLTSEPHLVTAWIGPAIGACCYEVSDQLAQSIAAASQPQVVVPGANDRPHVDLSGAVASQLRAAGVHDIRSLIRCTRCDADHLWSYRRHGTNAGRNHAFIWRSNP